MCGGSKGQTTTQQTSTTQASPEAMAAYQDILARAQSVAQTPYQAYEGERVAGFSPFQQQAFSQIQGLQGAGMDTLGEAGDLARQGSQAISGADIQRAMDPYQQQVIQTTMDEMQRQNAIEQSRLQGQAISAGAFGGDRAGIAASELAKRQGDTRAATMASLLSQGYGRAVDQAQADRQAAMAGSGQLSGLAQQEFMLPMAQTQALGQAGTAQQQLEQMQLNVPYQEYLEQRAYPFQTAQWLAGLSTGVGGAMGGTSSAQGTQTPAQPNPWSQALGAGLTLASLPVAGGGSLGGAALTGLMALSDERAKENIAPVGKLNDGQTVYKYNYKGEPQTHIGLIAQEVEKTHPEAVGQISGLKTVNYDAATKDAVPHKAEGGGLSMPLEGPSAVLPYSKGYVPTPMQYRALSAPGASLPQAPQEPKSEAQKFLGQAMDLAKSIRNARNAEMPSAQSWASGTTITPEPAAASTPEFGYLATGGRVPMADGGVPEETPELPPLSLSEFVPPPALEPREVGSVPGLAAGTQYRPPVETPTPIEPGRMGLGVAAPEAPAPAKGFDFSPEARQAMMQAGFALMASRSPWVGQAVGEAGMVGTQAYNEAQKIAEQRRKQTEAEKIQRERMEKDYIKTGMFTKDGRPVFINPHTKQTVDVFLQPIDPSTELRSIDLEKLQSQQETLGLKADVLAAQKGLIEAKAEAQKAAAENKTGAVKPSKDIVTKDGKPVFVDSQGTMYDAAKNILSDVDVVKADEWKKTQKESSKKEDDFKRMSNIYRDARRQTFDITSDMRALIPQFDNLTAGYGRNVKLNAIKGTRARDVEEKLGQVVSRLQLGALERLKAYSNTGASGLGATTQNEIAMLGRQIANLNADQSPEQLKKEANNLIRSLEFIESSMRDDMEGYFSKVSGYEDTMKKRDEQFEKYVSGERKSGRGAVSLPMTRDGKPDPSKMVSGQLYEYKGKYGTWDGSQIIPIQ